MARARELNRTTEAAVHEALRNLKDSHCFRDKIDQLVAKKPTEVRRATTVL